MNHRAPLRLHGYAVSNYFNIAHAALIETGRDFALITRRASQEPEFLQVSPMGKIPVLETPQGWIAETVAILGYIEDTMPSPTLHAQDSFLRARERQVMNIVQIYVEAPVRSLFPGTFLGGTNTPDAIQAARATLDRATSALRQLVSPRPFLLGESISYADLYAYYCLDIAERVTGFVYDRSILAELGLQAWSAHMTQRHSTQTVLASFEDAFSGYLADKQAAYQFTPVMQSHTATSRVRPRNDLWKQ